MTDLWLRWLAITSAASSIHVHPMGSHARDKYEKVRDTCARALLVNELTDAMLDTLQEHAILIAQESGRLFRE